ncbi:hypothetical protein PROFUN_07442 [Planoprotostelium fungivorum]|uniref:Uncharacterized protein n=1 Tax=Planoprotostelium fungivorum TaxID=1890364 RepID=A0A2P6NLK1_9EUKA|nr:hypothetical protein PROFUN_07442 [Planoprotostelium fungivorum]
MVKGKRSDQQKAADARYRHKLRTERTDAWLRRKKHHAEYLKRPEVMARRNTAYAVKKAKEKNRPSLTSRRTVTPLKIVSSCGVDVDSIEGLIFHATLEDDLHKPKTSTTRSTNKKP